MNLTINTSLSSMLHKTAELSGVMKSKLEVAQEYNEALESLQAIQSEGARLQGMLTDLSIAQESLEKLGFSDEWLALVNQDGHFFEATHIELSDLLGTLEEKGEICMEGLWDTIKSVLKKIWDFICGMLVKITNFIRSVLGILKTDIRSEESVNKSIKEFQKVCNGGKVPRTQADCVRLVGEEINNWHNNSLNSNGERHGAGNFPIYDRRDLLTRMCVTRMLANILINVTLANIKDTFNPNDTITVNDILGPGVNEYFGTNRNANFFVSKVLDILNSNPAEALEYCKSVQMFEWSGFKTTRVAKDLKKVASSVGIELHEEGATITPINDAIKTIDYSTVYVSVDNYLDVSAAVTYNLRAFDTASNEYKSAVERLKKYGDLVRRLLDAHKAFDASVFTNASDNEKAQMERENQHAIVKLRLLTKWCQEVVITCGKFDTDFGVCSQKLKLVGQVISGAMAKAEKEVTADPNAK